MSRKSEATKRKEAALSLEEARRLFEYDPETGNLFRKVRTAHRTKIGDIVGSLNSYRYLKASVNNKQYAVHRLVWFIYYGYWPKDQIDHLNRNGSDNRIDNLREVSQSENLKNKRKQSNNTSGVVGVCWDIRHNKWRAKITENRRIIHLGRFDTFEEAVEARRAAEVKYCFSPTHGK
jgi:hypothetical protein